MKLLHTRAGPLDCHLLQAEDSPPAPLTVVLCHGFGAPGDDLVPLGRELVRARPTLAQGVRFVFPEAPLSLEPYGYGRARAWWMIDMEDRIRLMQLGAEGERRLQEEVPEGLAPARQALMSTLETVMRSAPPGGRLVLAGFSQGGMVTTDAALSLDEPPLGLAVLSGTLLSRKDWERKAQRRRGLPVFQTHGRADPVLPYSGAEALKNLLAGAGLEVSFHPFDGGHTIPLSALEGLGAFLERLRGT